MGHRPLAECRENSWEFLPSALRDHMLGDCRHKFWKVALGDRLLRDIRESFCRWNLGYLSHRSNHPIPLFTLYPLNDVNWCDLYMLNCMASLGGIILEGMIPPLLYIRLAVFAAALAQDPWAPRLWVAKEKKGGISWDWKPPPPFPSSRFVSGAPPPLYPACLQISPLPSLSHLGRSSPARLFTGPVRGSDFSWVSLSAWVTASLALLVSSRISYEDPTNLHENSTNTSPSPKIVFFDSPLDSRAGS